MAAPLCIKPRSLLTAREAAAVGSVEPVSSELVAMRQLAMHFCALLPTGKTNCVHAAGGPRCRSQCAGPTLEQRPDRRPGQLTEDAQARYAWPGRLRTAPCRHVALMIAGYVPRGRQNRFTENLHSRREVASDSFTENLRAAILPSVIVSAKVLDAGSGNPTPHGHDGRYHYHDGFLHDAWAYDRSHPNLDTATRILHAKRAS